MRRRVAGQRPHWLLIRALVFAFAINAAQLYVYWASQGNSPHSLQDVTDESLYLRIALDQGRFMPQEAIYVEHAKALPLVELLTHWRPDQTYSHFAVGRLAVLLGLNVQQLNLLLDLACGTAGYITMYFLCALALGPSRLRLAELAAVTSLCLPWLSSLESLIDVHTLFPSVTAQIGSVQHTVLPIQEGVESQLSVVWMGLTLIAFVSCARDAFSRDLPLIALGAATGLGIYLYVLEWIAATVLILCLFLAAPIFFGGRLEARRVPRALILFGASFLCASLPGLIQIQAIRETKHIFINDPATYRAAFYAPVEWLIILVAGGAMLWVLRGRLSLLAGCLSAAILATIVAELCILNMQPLFGVATVGIFTVSLFTRPLLSALLVALLFLRFSEEKKYRAVLGASAAFIVMGSCIANCWRTSLSTQQEGGLSQLISFVRQHVPQGSVIAMVTYERPFQAATREWDWRWQPSALAALTGTHLLKEPLGLEWGALSPEETISRELALGAVFTGIPKLIRGCAQEIVTEPKRMFFQQWIPVQLTRRFNCERARDAIRDMDTCQALRSYAVDYVVWEEKFSLRKPDYFSSAARLAWRSTSGDIELFAFDRERAVREVCGGAGSAAS